MKTFNDLVFEEREDGGIDMGIQAVMEFPNGYGVSVIKAHHSYGGDKGYWELAVLNSDGSLTYDTPVTSDVEGWLTPDKVTDLMKQVQELAAAEEV